MSKNSKQDLSVVGSLLVIRLGAIGDVLRVLPTIARLRARRPDIRIGWAVEDWVVPILDGNPLIDHIHVVNRKALNSGVLSAVGELRRAAREIREVDYEVLLDFHGRFKSGVLGFLTRIPTRVGYTKGDSTEANHLFTNIHVTLQDRWESRVLRYLELLAPLDIDTEYEPGAHGLVWKAEDRDRAASLYEQAGRPRVAAYPGTSLLRMVDRWPAEKWKQLLARLGEKGVTTTIFWGPAEKELVEDIATHAGPLAQLAPPTSLPEMGAMIALHDAFIGSDTGAMHMAWLQGVPTAVFVGARPVATDRPLPPIPSRVLRIDELFDPALKKRDQSPQIISDVPVEAALLAVEDLLAGHSE
jgi:ADP-heptose:LPS heptosyltransferase